ncbi:hypothetical protein BDW59DRAFT_170071 [Aspergillus cavernicola]|uniref:Nucleoside phosphorylase domain-containing protein n=1 Tax=Aspergillus cavernicola TaxID=176166 RepID=A0ABR4IRT4_9EURO
MKRRRPRAEDFTLGWICPLPLEYAAAKSVLDELYDEAEYATGRIHNHDIVITCLPAGQMGTNAAAAAATRMLSSFPSLTAAFLVGIAGGVPSDKTDIRLGDVVVGQPEREYGGVVQYDFGKTITGGFQRIGSLNAPSHALLTAVSSFKSNLTTARKNMGNYLVDRPSSADVLFKASYDHPGGDSCSSCHPDMIVDRTQRNEDVGIFFGTVASGNQVIKDGITRDSMSSTLGGVLCFEMEAAGVVNLLPCLVVRGICDYADSHKNKVFQPIAAAAAAACTREILLYLPCASKLNHGELKAPAVEGSHQLSPTQRQIYLESLRFDQLDSRHRTIKLAHLKTCQWLLSCLEYKTWLDPEFFDQHHGFFWIKGKPGAGKSTIMKFAFTQATRKMINATVLSFFFNARGDALEKTVMGMYRSILLQLLEKLPDLQSVFHTLPTVPTHGQALDWDVETLKCLVIMAVEKLQHRQLICFIDALDECDEKQVWDMISFFEQLGELAVSRQARLLICLSSRHYPHVTIENKIELVLEDQDGHHQDISNYVHADLKAGRSKQVQQIKEEVIGRSSGIFLWVVLVVRILNEEYCHGHVHALKRRLKEIPDGLHELLNDILTRDNHNMKKTLLCLQWILYAKRPLTREELYFAILAGIEADPGFLADWTGDKVSEEELSIFVLDSSKGLAQITRSKNPTVQFIHESVRDFLQDKGLTNLPMGSIAPDSSHEALKNCCLSYVSTDLSLCLPQSLPAAKSPEGRDLAKTASQRYPFLEYAVQNLFHHANAASRLGIPQISFLANFPLTSWIVQSNLFEKHTTRRYTASAYLVYIFANNNFANLLEELIHTVHQGPNPTFGCFRERSCNDCQASARFRRKRGLSW